MTNSLKKILITAVLFIVLAVTGLAQTPVKLAWDYTDPIDRFVLYRSLDSVNFVALHSAIPSEARTVTDITAIDGQKYFYRLSAVLGELVSFPSNVVETTVEVVVVPPIVVVPSIEPSSRPPTATNLRGRVGLSNQVLLEWDWPYDKATIKNFRVEHTVTGSNFQRILYTNTDISRLQIQFYDGAWLCATRVHYRVAIESVDGLVSVWSAPVELIK